MPGISLIGPQCSGKSGVGRILSNELNLPFVDFDNAFFERQGISVGEYIQKYGIHQFRVAEFYLVSNLCDEHKEQGSVFAPGGGALANFNAQYLAEKNRETLRKFGKVIYLIPYQNNLKKSADILISRHLEDPQSKIHRPNILCTLEELQRRHPLYKLAANYTLSTRQDSQEEVAKSILRLL